MFEQFPCRGRNSEFLRVRACIMCTTRYVQCALVLRILFLTRLTFKSRRSVRNTSEILFEI